MVDSVNILTGIQSQITQSIQRSQKLVDEVQKALATGKEVSSAIDDPQNFFTAKSLSNRAGDLDHLMDNIQQNVRALTQAESGIGTLQSYLDVAESTIDEALIELSFEEVQAANQSESEDAVLFQEGNDTILLSGLPLSGASGSQVTVEFWMEWDGSDSVMPFSFGSYDLWIRGGSFGFNTFSSDVYGISNAGLANTPVHVAAVFTDSDVESNQIFINGVDQSLSHLRSLPFSNARAQIGSSARISGSSYGGGYQFGGLIDEVRIWDGARTAEEIQNYMNASITGPEANLVASYTFENVTDGAGGVPDESGNGYNGTLSGMTAGANVVPSNFPITVDSSVGTDRTTEYVTQYSEILAQIDDLVEDANYRGLNLLGGEDVTTFFNEDRSNTLVTEGIDATFDGLGLTQQTFSSQAELEDALVQIKAAREKLRSYAGTVRNNLGMINARLAFTQQLVNLLKSGADELTVADQNEKGAEMLALQTRQSLQTTALALSAQFNVADVLFR